MHSTQVNELALAVNTFATSSGATLSTKVEKNAELLLAWLQFLSIHHLTGTADCLLNALGPSIREVAASLAMGLVRPALFSLRTQIDLSLAWLYFRDHKVEWERVNATGEGFKMKTELQEYFITHNARFKARLATLKLIKTRNEEEPYRFLSAHIHGQSQVVLPEVIELKDVVCNKDECFDCAKGVFEVSEYLNDIFLSLYASQWRSLPKIITETLEKRFVSSAQKNEFFAD